MQWKKNAAALLIVLTLVLAFFPRGPKAEAEGLMVSGSRLPVTFTLPDDWDGKYLVEEDGFNGGDCLSVFHRESHEKEGSGLLFSLVTYSDSSYVTVPHYQAVGVLSDGSRSLNLIAEMPSDVQAASDCFEDYFSLYSDETFGEIFKTLKGTGGWALLPVDEEALYAANARFEYSNALYIGRAFNELPDGSEIIPEDWDAKMENNSFAVYDVNGDGREELLISVEDSYVAAMRMVVYHMKESGLEEELMVFPAVIFYGEGLVQAFDSHNHTNGEAWPYTLLLYNPEQQLYEAYASVYSWNREYAENDYNGTPFPASADADSNGVVYCIRTFGDHPVEKWVDDAEFSAWETEQFGDRTVLDVPWMAYTEENIEAVMNAS
ncbi:MAG: hypothetical protein K6C08_15220 [Oscillospiraceae bacterium]|nr:hypothetical protein [Oscillospiraceae bacterium]